MTNNDILRRLRYTFALKDAEIAHIFTLANGKTTKAEVSTWLQKDDDPEYKGCNDELFATFLNGFIVLKRGKQEGTEYAPEKKLNNNLILRKLKIALNLTSEDIIDQVNSAGLTISKAELGAFFRNKEHRHYRECKDQFLRNFLVGLQKKYRPENSSSTFQWKTDAD